MSDIRINQLPIETAPTSNEFLPIDGSTTRKSTIQSVVNAGAPVATKAKAEGGVDNNDRMTALTTKQSIASEVGVTISSQVNGALAATAVQPYRKINAGRGLTGGGDFSADRTISVGEGAGITVSDDAVGLSPSTQLRLAPSGGNTGQVLAKISSADFDFSWTSSGSGNVIGPTSVSDNSFAGFNGTTGKIIKELSASNVLNALKSVGAYAKDNILGTVSQSGGVPTGAVMETGSNANGIYIRFASGIQQCSFQLPLSYSTASDMIGTWNYPSVFSDLPFISFGETQFWSGSVKSFAMRTRLANRGTSGTTIVSGNPSSNNASGDIYYVHVTAIGRWF